MSPPSQPTEPNEPQTPPDATAADPRAEGNGVLAYESPEDERPATASPTESVLEQELPGGRRTALPPHDPYAAMRLPVYRLFVFAYSLAVIGSQVMSVAVQWDLYQRTHAPLTLGILGAVQAVPVITLALFAGHVSDIFSRKTVLMWMQVALVLCPLALAILVQHAAHWETRRYLGFAYAIILINAVALTFARPARSALLPALVPKSIFSNAVTWNASMFEVASMAGPAVGGFLIARWSVSLALWISAGCTAICLWLTYLLPAQRAASHGEPLNFSTLIAGVRFVWKTKLLLAVLTLDLFAVLLGGATFLLPVYASDILHVGSVGFGWLRAAPSLGAITMAMVIAHAPPMKHAGRAMLLAVAGFGAATVVFGLSHSFWLSLFMLYLTGAFDNVSVVVRHTLVQLLTPDVMRGRVSAVNQVFIGASNELGGFESGVTAAIFGPFLSVVGGGIGTVLVVIGVSAIWPQVRKFGSLHSAEPA